MGGVSEQWALGQTLPCAVCLCQVTENVIGDTAVLISAQDQEGPCKIQSLH